MPPCLLQDETPFVVPAGDTALAQQATAGFGFVQLTDATGNELSVTEVRNGRTSVVRTAEALAPGSYVLTAQCGVSGEPVVREVIVVEATELPEHFGSLAYPEDVSPPRCSALAEVSVAWTPTAAFASYLNLTELTLHRGDENLGVLARARPYAANALGVVEVFIPLCPAQTACISGKGEYHVEARIAGEEAAWLSPPVAIDPRCKPDPFDDEGLACSFAPERVQATWGMWLLPLVLWFGRRQLKRRDV